MKKTPIDIPVSYVSIRVTHSRIAKGLLAIPASLRYLFPNVSSSVQLIDSKGKAYSAGFTPHESRSKEARIVGIRALYQAQGVQDEDELVLQPLGEGRYRLWTEPFFISEVKNKLTLFADSATAQEAEVRLHEVADIARNTQTDALKNVYVWLSQQRMEQRRRRLVQSTSVKASISAAMRKLLVALYKGKCQVSNFGFIQKNGTPYFEIHHIDASAGHHPKNLLVVSPNVHAQFEHAHLKQTFDEAGWLREVQFNAQRYKVYQIIDTLPQIFEKALHF